MKFLNDIHSFNLWINNEFIDTFETISDLPDLQKANENSGGQSMPDLAEKPKPGRKRNFSKSLKTNDLDFEENEYWK